MLRVIAAFFIGAAVFAGEDNPVLDCEVGEGSLGDDGATAKECECLGTSERCSNDARCRWNARDEVCVEG